MYKVKIIRHAERLDYKNPLQWFFSFGQYWADTPLTNNGYLLAYQKGVDIMSENFNPQKIYTSPYIRTMATASQIQKSITSANVVIEPLISEYQQLFRHNTTMYPAGIPAIKLPHLFFEYPESYENFVVRVEYAINSLLEKNTDDFIIVTHGAFLSAFMAIYCDIQKETSFAYLSSITFMYDTINKKILQLSIKTN